jgi:hypothetical protein
MKMLVTCRYSFYRQVHFKKMHYIIILKAFKLNDFELSFKCVINHLWGLVLVDKILDIVNQIYFPSSAIAFNTAFNKS